VERGRDTGGAESGGVSGVNADDKLVIFRWYRDTRRHHVIMHM